jgi:hypothetical protein
MSADRQEVVGRECSVYDQRELEVTLQLFAADHHSEARGHTQLNPHINSLQPRSRLSGVTYCQRPTWGHALFTSN